MRNAERILAAYDAVEPWRADHDTAMQCFEMEEILAVGNMAYDLVSFIDAAWQDRVARGKVLFTEEDDRQIGELYRKWIEVSERKVGDIGRLAHEGYEVHGADTFLTHLEEARAILESRALEDHMRPVEDILPLAKGNPRPERYGK